MTTFHPLSALWDHRIGISRSRKEIDALQLRRLQAVVAHAYQNVTYYRKLFDSVGFLPRHLRRVSDIEVIPVTTRFHLQATPREELIATGYTPDKLRARRTSGSTGTPLTIYRTQGELTFGRISRLRHWRYHGLRLNDRVLTISGRPTTAQSRPWLRSLPLPFHLNLSVMERVESRLAAFDRLRPTVLYGYSCHVAELARLIRDRGVDSTHLRILATSGDLLPPGFRKLMRETWNTDPIDIYNSSEMGDIGWQCKARKGFHLNSDLHVVEFLRNLRPVNDGEQGEIAVTHLFSYSMPLIRYNGGDLGVPGDDPCDCGVQFPKMRAIEGRTLNACPLPDGRWFINFNRLLTSVPEINAYQVIQQALDRFQISVVPGAGFVPEVLTRIANEVGAHLGEGVAIDVRQVLLEEMIQTPGKLPPVIPFARLDFGNGATP